jgi:hypothetical protein
LRGCGGLLSWRLRSLCLLLCWRLSAVRLEGGPQLARNRWFDRRRRTLDEFAQFLEFRQGYLAIDTELACDFVYAWFCSHNSPIPGLRPE